MSDNALPPPDTATNHDTSPGTGDDASAEADDATTAETGAGVTTVPMLRNVGTELFATALLMLAGPGVIVLGQGRIDTLAVALSFGAGLAIAIGVIGAVANPALSLALLVVREISPKEAVGDWMGQVAGAIVGGALIWGINDATRVPDGANGWDRGGLSELGSVIAAELVFTIVVVVVFLSAISQGLSKSAIAAFTGLTYAVAHLVLLGISGGGLNPARSIGSAIFSDGDPNPLAQVIVFVVVPLVAAVAAVFIWLAIDEAEVDDTIFDDSIVDTLGDKIDGTVD